MRFGREDIEGVKTLQPKEEVGSFEVGSFLTP